MRSLPPDIAKFHLFEGRASACRTAAAFAYVMRLPIIRQPRSQVSTGPSPVRPLSPLFGLLAFAGWIGAEIITFNLVAGWTGGGVAFFLLIMKSVLGAVFVQRVIRQKLFSVLRQGGIVLDGTDAAAAWLKGLGGFLLVFPGFAAGIMGLALLTPSVRRLLTGRKAARKGNPREIELDETDWREVPDGPGKRIRRRKTPDET
jgi:UPF0716 family protein affecting phage T7 exclusion